MSLVAHDCQKVWLVRKWNTIQIVTGLILVKNSLQTYYCCREVSSFIVKVSKTSRKSKFSHAAVVPYVLHSSVCRFSLRLREIVRI